MSKLTPKVDLQVRLKRKEGLLVVSVAPLKADGQGPRQKTPVIDRRWVILVVSSGRAELKDEPLKVLSVVKSVGEVSFQVVMTTTEDDPNFLFEVEWIENNFPFRNQKLDQDSPLVP